MEHVASQKEGSFVERGVKEKKGSTDRVGENNVTDNEGSFARAFFYKNLISRDLCILTIHKKQSNNTESNEETCFQVVLSTVGF